METKSCSKIIHKTKKIDSIENPSKIDETKNLKLNNCIDDKFLNNEQYLYNNFLEEESLLNSFFEDTKKKPKDLAPQMENLIENSKTVENMHLLSDYFNDNFFSNKLTETKDKLDDNYQLNNDKKLNLSTDDISNTDNSFEQNLLNKNFISSNDIYSINQINSNTVDTTQLHSSMQFHLQQNSNLRTNSLKNSNLYLAKFDNSIQCNQNNLFNNFHSSQTSNFNNDLLSPQLQTNIETTDSNQLINDLNLSMNNQSNYQLNKQNRKKFKNMNNHPKKKTIKFHEYKGPTSQQKNSNKDNTDNSEDLFREQQICLQKQLLNQINNPSKTSKSSSAISSCFVLNNSSKSVHSNVSQKDLNLKIEANCNDSNKNSDTKNSSTDSSDEKQINYLDTSFEQNIFNNSFLNKTDENEDLDKLNKKNNSKESKDNFNPISPQLTPPYHQNTTFTKIVSDSLPVSLNDLKIEKLEDYKVQDLKIYLKKCNLPVSGSKMSLVERLKNYLIRTNPSIKSSINNIQQLTPPNTPMSSDHHNSDSNDGKNNLINQKINSATNCTYNGTKFFVNNNNISHFQASIPINSYTVQQNQPQFQFQNSSLISNSINQANKLTNSNNSSFTLPLASIQPSQIHFLSNPIISNSVNGNQQFSTNLTVQPQMTTIAQATTINCAPTTIGTLPTIVTPQFTPILFYPRNSSNSTSANAYNQTACLQDNIVQSIESNSPIKSSIKSSIRKNILLKQQKQLQQQQMHLQQLQQNEKNVINNKSSEINDDTKICSKTSNKNKMLKVTKVEVKKNYPEIEDNSFSKTKDFMGEKKNLSSTTDNDNSNNLNNVFELLMEVEELADFMNANKDVNLSNNKQNDLIKFDEKVVEDKINFLGSNDYSNMDSILNNYQLNFNEDLENENNFTDWLNNDESLIVNSLYDDDENKNYSNNKDDLKIDEEMRIVSDLDYNYQNDFNKTINYFDSNSMDPTMPNFCIDQNLPNFYLDENDLTFKSTSNDFDVNCDKTNFTAY